MEESNVQGNHALYRIMEQLLEIDNIEDALAAALTTIIDALDSQAGTIWLFDRKTDRLSPVFHIGKADISNITIDNGIGIEGVVTKTGKSMMITDCENDPRYTYTVVDDQDLKSVGGLNQCKPKWSKVKSIKILSGEINPDEAR